MFLISDTNTVQMQRAFTFDSAVSYVTISNPFLLLLHIRPCHNVQWLQSSWPLDSRELCMAASAPVLFWTSRKADLHGNCWASVPANPGSCTALPALSLLCCCFLLSLTQCSGFPGGMLSLIPPVLVACSLEKWNSCLCCQQQQQGWEQGVVQCAWSKSVL